MSILVQLQPLTPTMPGQARLIIKRWQGALDGLEFSIQRNQDPAYLQRNGSWGTNAVWFSLSLNENEDGGLGGVIGAEILDPILEGSGNASYLLHMQQGPGGDSAQGRIRLFPGLLASAAGGETDSSRVTAQLTTQVASAPAAVQPPVPEPIVEPEPAAVTDQASEPESLAEIEPIPEPALSAPLGTAPKKRLNPLLIALPVVALLALAAGTWLWFKPDTEEIPTVMAAAPEVVDTSCSIAGLDNQSELEFVQTCIQQELDSEQLLEVIAGAKAAGQCGVAQRLYANRAQGGDVQIALAYAREYDPKYHQANPCFAAPHKDTAGYWYETVLAVAPDHQEAQQRLGELSQ